MEGNPQSSQEAANAVSEQEKIWYQSVILLTCEQIWMHQHPDDLALLSSTSILNTQVNMAFAQVTTHTALSEDLGLIRNVVRSVITFLSPTTPCSDEEDDDNMPIEGAEFVDQLIQRFRPGFEALSTQDPQGQAATFSISERILLFTATQAALLATHQALSSQALHNMTTATATPNTTQQSTHPNDQAQKDTSSDPTP